MNSKYNIEATDHVTAADHESEEELGNTPSQGAPNPSGWHHLPTGSAYSLWVCPVSTDCLPLSHGTSSQSNLFA